MITSYIVTMHTKVPYSAVSRSFFFTVYSIETIFFQPVVYGGIIRKTLNDTFLEINVLLTYAFSRA